MQLTEIQLLDQNYSQSDAYEIAAVAASTIGGTPVTALRWQDVSRSDAEASMREAVTKGLKGEFAIKRISAVADDKDVPSVDLAEHLVIRDLDLSHLLDDAADPASPQGRIVAHAEWRYWAKFAIAPEKPKVGGDNITAPPLTKPIGRNGGIQTAFDSKTESILNKHFSGLPMFGLLGISTLTPSHLRRGLAKRMTQWIVPMADQFAIPVVLVASPLGVPLYRKCGGYVEYPDLDIVIDLEEWGGHEIHRHSMMIRWPEDMSRLSDEWMSWRSRYGPGQVL